jgi:DsbC/DsbD-like thiol-disulfide interchange protein
MILREFSVQTVWRKNDGHFQSPLKLLKQLALLLLIVPAQLLAQDALVQKGPSVTMLPAPVFDVTRGKVNEVDLRFHVAPGFHINSNTPTEEYLIPTALKLDPPTDIVVGKIIYPPPQTISFAFAPNEKLSVYSGSFILSVSVRPLSSVLPTKYMFRGRLKYQACDNAQCFPPKQLPVQFEVKVLKAPAKARPNPAQSPHVHN